MKRSKEWLRTRDIDWAVKIGDHYIHVSSAGGDLPDIVEENLFRIWRGLKKTHVLFSSDQIEFNEDYLSRRFPIQENNKEIQFQREWYIHSFRAMAMRGFYSFDRDITSPIDDSKYYLVAYPKTAGLQRTLYFPEINQEIDPIVLSGCDVVSYINRLAPIENWKTNRQTRKRRKKGQ